MRTLSRLALPKHHILRGRRAALISAGGTARTRPRALDDFHRLPDDLGFGRIVVSETEVPITLVLLVESG
jgi:hypothetical protein